MEHVPHPQHPDLAVQLPADVYYCAIHQLRGFLPPPVIDTPEEIIRRDNAAMAKVAALLPVNAIEADLAAHYVGASICATDAQRLAVLHRDDPDPKQFLQCAAQSACQRRAAMRALAMLQRTQAERRKQDANPTIAGQNAWAEHIALSYMAEALDRPKPAGAERPPPQPPEPTHDEAEPQRDVVAEADFYAKIHPRRVAEIRRLGGLPKPCTYGPPDDELLHQLVHGRTPTLLALDEEYGTASHQMRECPTQQILEMKVRPDSPPPPRVGAEGQGEVGLATLAAPATTRTSSQQSA